MFRLCDCLAINADGEKASEREIPARVTKGQAYMNIQASNSDHVGLEVSNGIGIITIDSPPMNTTSQAVRAGLLAVLNTVFEDDTVQVVLLTCAGRSFIAGAEISEFGKTPAAPALADVIDVMDAATKPIVAAIHGVALGAGFEIALACHYRLALKTAKVGLPEVNLGILPGAGGTQRTPRLVGAEKALEMILSGRHVKAQEALEIGLLDEVSDGDDARAAGLIFAQRLIAQNMPVRRVRDMHDRIAVDHGNDTVFETATAGLARRGRGLFSPYKIVEAIRAAVDLPFDEGIKRERELFLECIASPQREGLIHAFFSERKVSKIPEGTTSIPRAITHVGILGGGTMGSGISVALMNAGINVTMIEQDAEAAERGRQRILGVYDRSIKKGRMSVEECDALMAKRYAVGTDFAMLSEVDLVVEAVFENMDVKKDMFAKLDKIVRPGAILATNTSYLDINEIAAVTSRPEDVVGLHFFSPANIMKLLEVVVADKTADDVVATSFDLGKKLRKVAVRAGMCDGFIGNRLMMQYRRAADYLMEDGASPYDIDAALRKFGFAMGPYQVADLAGMDIGWATRKRLAPTRDPNERYVAVADRICEKGWFGQKTKRGYYIYNDEFPRGGPNPEVLNIIDAERAAKGITPKSFDDDEIVRRYMLAMINGGADIVSEGIALRPLDVDMVLLFGYGFPRYRGGPMKYADMIGLENVLASINEYAKEDANFWQPSKLLVDLVAAGKNFDSLNGFE